MSRSSSYADPWPLAWGRRAISISVVLLLFLLASLLFPVLLLGAGLVDLLSNRRWLWARSFLFATLYLACEIIGIGACLLIWLGSGVWAGGSRRRFLDWNWRLKWWWARTLMLGGAALWNLRFEVEGDEEIGQGPGGTLCPRGPRGVPGPDGPFIVLVRHSSLADTLLPVFLLSLDHGIALRYVLKRELLWDPCLDIVGNRLAMAFVRRGSGETTREIAEVARLLEDLGPRDGVVIYPEGTRFSAAKRQRVIERLEHAGERRLLERARSLRHLLPPRLGGPLELLERNRRERLGADVLFLAHTGFEGSASARELLDGAVLGRTIRMGLWRVPAERIPAGRDALVDWLFEHWERVDAFVARHRRRDLEAAAEHLRIS